MTEAAGDCSARASRFARRLRGERDLTFAEHQRHAAASRHAAENGENLLLVLALLAARPALDRELSGARLAAIASQIGDDLLDAVRDADLDAIAPEVFDDALPPLPALARRGDRLLSQVAANPDLAALAELAASLVRDAKVLA